MTKVRAAEIYVNISHAWFLTAALYDEGTARGLLHHVGFVPALGDFCLARPQRRFVVLSPRRRYCVVAEGKLVTVFALAGIRGGDGAWLPSQQVCELEAGLGELLGNSARAV